MSHSVTVNPSGKVITVNGNDSLMAQLKQNGFNIKSTCGGCASCGTCVIQVVAGEESLNDPSFEEKQLIGNVFHITRERLSCQTYVTGNVTIDISEHDQSATEKKTTTKVRKAADLPKIAEEKELKRQEDQKNRPKKLGGRRRPKAFDFKDE
jgi:2Fe-2S ferredoxin